MRVSSGDFVIFLSEGGTKIFSKIEEGMNKIKSIGVISGEKIIGKEYGDVIKLGNRKFLIMKPSLQDIVETIQRKTQIITLKDSCAILAYSGIHEGSIVVEGGTGSGALTSVLAYFVKKSGRVYTYDVNEEYLKFAERNLANYGLHRYCKFVLGDITSLDDVAVRNADAFIVDIPNPWDAVPVAREVLKSSSFFASYSPNIEQARETVIALRKNLFEDIYTFENLQRSIIVHEYGTRPSFDMLGHTGYITIARKVINILR